MNSCVRRGFLGALAVSGSCFLGGRLLAHSGLRMGGLWEEAGETAAGDSFQKMGLPSDPVSTQVGLPESIRQLHGKTTVHSGYTLKEDIVYAASGQALNLYWPDKPNPDLPLLVMVHGGGWREPNLDNMQAGAEYLVGQGYAIANIRYRLAPAHPYPQPVDDVRDAIRWARTVSPNQRVSLIGYSAGGHLALLSGFRAGRGEVERIIAIAPPTDLTVPYNQYALQNIGDFLGDTQPQEAMPITYASAASPPVLLLHGDADQSVSYRQSEMFQRGLQKAKAKSELRVLPGKDHFWLFYPQDNPETFESMDRFLRGGPS